MTTATCRHCGQAIELRPIRGLWRWCVGQRGDYLAPAAWRCGSRGQGHEPGGRA